MLKLLHFALGPFSRKVRIVLREKELDAALEATEPWQCGDDFSALNPAGEVPVLLDGERVIVDVEDRGRGVLPEDLERIFDKFYRVEHGDRQIAGTGLGLSICRGIVEEHGGRIEAMSPAPSGVGTLIRVSLPIEEERPTVETTEERA